MLVLSRKADQSITLDCGVEIRVIAVNGRCVRLGIDAPDSIRIVRTELLPTDAWLNAVETRAAGTCSEKWEDESLNTMKTTTPR